MSLWLTGTCDMWKHSDTHMETQWHTHGNTVTHTWKHNNTPMKTQWNDNQSSVTYTLIMWNIHLNNVEKESDISKHSNAHAQREQKTPRHIKSGHTKEHTKNKGKQRKKKNSETHKNTVTHKRTPLKALCVCVCVCVCVCLCVCIHTRTPVQGVLNII